MRIKRPKLNCNLVFETGYLRICRADLKYYYDAFIMNHKIHFYTFVLLHLNQMLYALCLSYHYNTEAALFACPSSGWTTTTGRLLGPKMRNSIKCHSQAHSDALLLAIFRLLAQRSTNWARKFVVCRVMK